MIIMTKMMNEMKKEDLVMIIEKTFGEANAAAYKFFFPEYHNVEFEAVHVLQKFTNRKHTKMEGTINIVAGNKITQEVLCIFNVTYIADIEKTGEEYQISNIKIMKRSRGNSLGNLACCLIGNKCREENIRYLFDSDMKLMIAY